MVRHKIVQEFIGNKEYLSVYEKRGFFSGWRYKTLFPLCDITKARAWIRDQNRKPLILETYTDGEADFVCRPPTS